MRGPSAQYLEAAKVEELAADLQQQGYRVVRDARLGDQQFDLLAERDGQRVAFEIKARSRLAEATGDVVRLREAARAAGLSDFRLVVVTPPRVVSVEIENLEAKLGAYMLWNETPPELAALSSVTRVEDVTNVEIESVSIHPSHIQVRGSATIDVELNFGGGSDQNGVTVSESLPLTFDLDLSPELEIVQMNQLHIDTGEYAE